MGSSQNKVSQNPNFDINEYNRRVQNSGVYGRNPIQRNQRIQGQTLPRGNMQPIIESTVNKISLKYSLQKNSLFLHPIDRNTLQITMKVRCKEKGDIRIYISAIEQNNTIQSQYLIIESISQNENDQTITRNFNLKNPLSALDLERRYVKDWYPIIVSIGDQNQRLTTYARTAKNFEETIVIKQKLQNEGKQFFIKEVYGLAKNSGERLCIICFSSPSDVVINPCGHVTLCMQCAKQLMKSSETCPICRKSIANYEHITEDKSNN